MGAADGPDDLDVVDRALKHLTKDENTLIHEARAIQDAIKAAQELEARRTMDALREQMRQPANIDSIEVRGAKNTRRAVLDGILKPLVQDGSSTTLRDVLSRLSVAHRKLDRLGIFEPNPNAHISSSRSDPLAALGALDVAIHVREKSRLAFKAGTEFGSAEGSAYTNAVVRNLLGCAEQLSLSASAGTRTLSAYAANLSAPVLPERPDVRLGLDATRSTTAKPWASHDEVQTGAAASLAWLTGGGETGYDPTVPDAPDRADSHLLTYTGAWRQLTGLAAGASPCVRADAGDSFKSSLSYMYRRDRRDSPLLPQSGYLFRAVAELAGWGPLGGDVSFFKPQVDMQGAVPLGRATWGISLGASMRLGMLYPLPLGFGGRAVASRINDRFQLGGPTDVRGFKLGGLGPHDGHDALGGDVLAAGGVSLMVPVPRIWPRSSPPPLPTEPPSASSLRLQFFANGGRLVALRSFAKGSSRSSTNTGRSSKERKSREDDLVVVDPDATSPTGTNTTMDAATVARSMRAAIADISGSLPSVTAGVGLVYAHPVARFELNFSLPLVMRRGEEARKGLQFGVGLDFL